MKFTQFVGRLAVLGMTLGVMGCNLFFEEPATVELKARSPRSIVKKTQPAEPRKLHPFVECMNTASVKVTAARKHYMAWADSKPFTCKGAKGIPRVWLLPTNICLEQMKREARNLPKNDQLLKATGDYVASFLQISRLSERLSPYYDESGYLKDQCTTGKRLHRSLSEAFERFERADRKIREIVDLESTKLKLKMLDEYERKFGKNEYFFALKIMLDAKAMMRTLDSEIVRKRVRTKNLERAANEFRKSYSGFKQSRTRGSVGGPELPHASEFRETAERFHQKVQRLDKIKRWKANPKAEAYYQELVREYNFLVEQSNRMRVSDPP